MNRYLLFALNIFSILAAFLLGFYFEKGVHEKAFEQLENKEYIINIKQTKTKLDIDNKYENIKIRIDGKDLTQSGIILKK